MATDEERLLLTLEARTALLERQMKNASKITGREFKGMEAQAKSAATKMNAAFSGSKGLGGILSGARGLGGILAGGFIGGAFISGAVKFSEAATRIDNSLKVAGLSGEKLNEVYGKLRDSAVKNAAPLESLVELYSRASLIQNELGVSSDRLIAFTDNVALALRVSGKSAQESSGALLQLSQALGSGVVRAEEFNSVVEGAPTILQAAAKGIKEAEGSVAKLRTIMLAGGLSSKALFEGFIAGSGSLQEKVQDVQITFGQSMENFQTALIDTAREFNTTTGASEKFAGGINNIAKVVSDFDVSGFISKIREAGGALEQFLNQAGNSDVFTRLNQSLGLMDESGRVINPDLTAAKDETASLSRQVELLQKTIEKNTSLGFDNTEALARLSEVQKRLAEVRGGLGNISPTLPNPSNGDALPIVMRPGNPDRKKDDFVAPNPISLADPQYKPPATSKPKSSATPAVKKTADDRITADIQQVKDRTEALRLEAEMVGKSHQAQEARKMALDLEQSALADLREEARKKGVTDLDSIKLSSEQVTRINEVADAYGRQAAELRKVQETQERAESAASEFYDTFKSGVIGAITGAESLKDALSGVLKKLAEMLLNSAFDALFKPSSGGIGGGIGGGIFEGIGKILGFDKGGYTGAGGKYDPAGIVHKGEYVFDAETTKRIGVSNLKRMQGYAQGGLVGAPSMSLSAPRVPRLQAAANSNQPLVVNFSPVIDNRGASVEAVAKTQQALDRMKAELPATILSTMTKAKSTRQWK
ncbi:tape measure protein [Phyllobacterium sp. 628]|uniref:tape measure protein n=1 Tax=Phyllobacterium sp. 628 TaxID=2718938 RepID=UPI00166266A8|nr:tape measure protein [Phyllobacterium sp. 628]QND51533.1 tape measure protein [Phyllobacterium sp. 628]